MDDGSRAALAYIAAQLIEPQEANYLFDKQRGLHVGFEGQVSTSSINLFDFGRGCRLAGSPGRLFDHGRACNLWLRIHGTGFIGFDFGDAQHFNGKFQLRCLTLYDFARGRAFEYLL